MAKFKTSAAFDQYISKLEKLESDTMVMLKQIVYVGAGDVADAVRSEIANIPTGRDKYRVSEAQIQGLLDGLGISQIREEDGTVNAKIGMDGYNGIATKKYPKGQPNAMIARSIMSGTSYTHGKYNFIQKAVKKSKAKAESDMSKKCDDLISKMNINGGNS